jgi:HEAT repeat protein
VAKAIATLLTGSPLLQDLALKEILRLDRGEAGFHAGVLAAAVGLVPDPACATKLLNTAKAAKGPDVVLAIVRALGQNRYGMEVPPGTMTISSTFTDNNTPIQEEDVRMGLLALVQACRGRREPVAQTLLNSTVEVLAFCQEHPDVKALLSEMASGDDKAERTVALQALAVGRSESAVEPLAEALQKARSPAEARAASMGLIRLGTHASIGRVLEKLKEPSTPSEIRIGLLDSLLMVNSGPLTPEQEVAACVLECMASDDSRVRDCAIRVAGGVAAKGVASEELFTKLLAMARDAKISERTRVNVMNALRPRAAQREVARAMAEDLLMGPSSGHDLRAACLNYLANQARPDDAEEFIRLLSEWRERPQLASMVGQIDDIIVRTRAMRDRAGQR